MKSKVCILVFLTISVLAISVLVQFNSKPFFASYIRSSEFAALLAEAEEYCELNSVALTPNLDLNRVSVEFTALNVKSRNNLVHLIDKDYRNHRVDFVVRTKNQPETHTLSGLNKSSFSKPQHSN